MKLASFFYSLSCRCRQPVKFEFASSGMNTEEAQKRTLYFFNLSQQYKRRWPSLMNYDFVSFNFCMRYIHSLSCDTSVSPNYLKAHILPFEYRLKCKACPRGFKCVRDIAPVYLTNLIHPYPGRSQGGKRGNCPPKYFQ